MKWFWLILAILIVWRLSYTLPEIKKDHRYEGMSREDSLRWQEEFKKRNP